MTSNFEFDDIPFDTENEKPHPVSAQRSSRACERGTAFSNTVPNQDNNDVLKAENNNPDISKPEIDESERVKTGANIPDTFRAWINGFDSLYLTFEGTLRASVKLRLAALKEKTKDKASRHEAQYVIEDHNFEIKRGGRNNYLYVLADGSYEIEAVGASNRPVFSVKILSGQLRTLTLQEIEDDLMRLLWTISDHLEKPKISRVDLHLDFTYENHILEALTRKQFVTLAKSKTEYSESDSSTGWVIGAGGKILARLYNKTRQLATLDDGSDNVAILQEAWIAAGWDEDETIWRIEFQLRRESLRDYKIERVQELEADYQGLWSSLTSVWLRISDVNKTDSKRNRWPTSAFWTAIHESVMDKGYATPLSRIRRHDRAPSKEYLGENFVRAWASYAAISGAEHIAGAQTHAKDLINNLDMRFGKKGRPLDQVLNQTLKDRKRTYNLRIKNDMRSRIGLPPEEGTYGYEERL